MVGITQCRQCLNGQGTEGVRYAVEVVNNRSPTIITRFLPFLIARTSIRSLVIRRINADRIIV